MKLRALIVPGVLAGVAVMCVDFLFNGVIFASQDQAAIANFASDPALVDSPVTLAVILGVDLILGFILAWTYAAIRPRLGAGPRTAVAAAAQVFCVNVLPWTLLTYLGAISWSFWRLELAVTFASLLAGALVAGRIYAENGQARLA